PLMPKIIAPPGMPAVIARDGAHHYRLVGIELTTAPGSYSDEIVALGGSDQRSIGALAYDLEIDRCYIHGDRTVGSKRGVQLNSGRTSIVNSHISDFKGPVQDAQAILGWNGSGPFRIINNRLEGAAENIAFGGAVPAIAGLVPSDIEVRYNHIVK